MSLRRKILIGVLVLVIVLGGLYYLAIYSLFNGNGPSPKLVLVVSSKEYKVEDILGVIDGMEAGLDPKINKKDALAPHDFSYYKHAYWYPSNGSNTYGIAIVEWDTSSWDNDDSRMGGSYFIDVYSEAKECKLCSSLKVNFQKSKIDFSSPCEQSKGLTKYEKIRCDI